MTVTACAPRLFDALDLLPPTLGARMLEDDDVVMLVAERSGVTFSAVCEPDAHAQRLLTDLAGDAVDQALASGLDPVEALTSPSHRVRATLSREHLAPRATSVLVAQTSAPAGGLDASSIDTMSMTVTVLLSWAAEARAAR